MFRQCFLLLATFCVAATGGVVRIHVLERSDVLNGKSFGAAGAYERLAGKVYFEVDPKLDANRIICDIDFAPVNERGMVEFSADLDILKPRDPAAGNGTVLFEVSNRGGRGLHGVFSRSHSGDPKANGEFGDEFLLQQGFTLAWLGWQFDVPEMPGALRLYAPAATDGGKPITGLVRSEFVPNDRVSSFSLADRTMIAYPAIDPGDRSTRLTVRDTATGPRSVIPLSQWQFARDENGKPVADSTRVFMRAGFEPGRIYEVVYRAQDPVLVGLGAAGIRDFLSFLKYGVPTGAIIPLGDQRRHVKRVLGFGSSQSGRFLRTFLYYGFNADEQSRQVFDGVWAHVAGAGRGSFNHRFAQPSRDGQPFMNLFYPTDILPFSDLEQLDPETGRRDGLLARAVKAGVVPKVFYTNGSHEYWGRVASLTHTTIDGKADFAPAKDTRIYVFAGTQHGPSAFPPRRDSRRYLSNPNDYRAPMRALLAAFQRWLADGVEPPPSQYPKIADETLVAPERLRFPKIPGVEVPTRFNRAWRLDYGAEFLAKGIVTVEPPVLGKPFPTLVPQVDPDGNEIAGIKVPEVQVPLATATGWNLRDPKTGAPREMVSLAGGWIPFPRTEAERSKNRDPRVSLQNRYGSRGNYLKRIEAAARSLVQDGYLLERDVPALLERAGGQWDYALGLE